MSDHKTVNFTTVLQLRGAAPERLNQDCCATVNLAQFIVPLPISWLALALLPLK